MTDPGIDPYKNPAPCERFHEVPMTLAAQSPTASTATQVGLACALAAAGVYFLLPKPRGRKVAFGVFLALAGLAVLGTFLLDQFGPPAKDDVGTGLFCLFASGAVGFATVLIAQRNPARGAIAFAFVVLNVSGLFVLLAAPFLAAATVVVYAGAIIVTFLFVLMLSHTLGHSPENDRTREPLLGSLAGFAFAGLVLFGLYESKPDVGAGPDATYLPSEVLTDGDKSILETVAEKLRVAAGTNGATAKSLVDATESARVELAGVLSRIRSRFGFVHSHDAPPPPPADLVLRRVRDVEVQSNAVENTLTNPASDPRRAVEDLRGGILLLRGSVELPARNVSNLGYLLYSEYLLTVELAGALLLVATIGAVAIAGRKGVAA